MDKDKLIEDAQNAFNDFVEDKNKPLFQNSKYGFIPPTIKHPDSGGGIEIGDKAYGFLLEVVNLVVKDNNLSRVILEEDVTQIVLELFRDVSFGLKNEIDHGDIFFQEVLSRIESRLKDYIIYVPFIASYNSTVKEQLSFGTVVVHSASSFEEVIKVPFEKATETDDDFSSELEMVVGEYKKYSWIIEVPVRNVFSSKVATEIAAEVATIVLNAFHLRISASHSDYMSTGFDVYRSLETNQLFISPQSKLSWGRGFKPTGNVGLPDELFSIFQDDLGIDIHRAFSKSIELFLDARKDYPHNRRLLEATHWYGDAIRETSKTVSIVKYVSALERLVIFAENSSLTSRICNRITALLLNRGFIEAHEVKILKEQIKNLYHLRSSILHGSISPSETKLSVALDDVDLLCRKAILSFCSTMNNHIAEENSEHYLKKWLIGLVTSLNVDKS